MIIFAISNRVDGSERAVCGEHEVTAGGSALHACARKVVAAGEPDGPWQATRDGRTVLTGSSLWHLAATTISMGDLTEAVIRWKPHPQSHVQSALEHVIAHVRWPVKTASGRRGARGGARKALDGVGAAV